MFPFHDKQAMVENMVLRGENAKRKPKINKISRDNKREIKETISQVILATLTPPG